MRERFLRIGMLVVVLFAINAAARLTGRFGFGDGTPDHLAAQDRLAWAGWGAVAVTMAVAAAWWVRRRPQGEAGGELAAAAFAAALLYAVAGPFLSEPPRFLDGVSGVIVQIALYLTVAGVGALTGALIMIAAGVDYKSRMLRQYAQSKSSKPRRPVRR